MRETAGEGAGGAVCGKGASHSSTLDKGGHTSAWGPGKGTNHTGWGSLNVINLSLSAEAVRPWKSVLHHLGDHLLPWKTPAGHCCAAESCQGKQPPFRQDTKGQILDRLGLLRGMFSGRRGGGGGGEQQLVTCQTAVAEAGWWPNIKGRGAGRVSCDYLHK